MLARIEAVLAETEDRTDFVRTAVEASAKWSSVPRGEQECRKLSIARNRVM